MNIPRKYAHKVASLNRLDPDEYNTARYCVNLKDGYTYDGEGLHYTESYQEALAVMKNATR